MIGSDPLNLRKMVLEVVRDACEKLRVPYKPEMIINGRDGFSGDDAEELIYAAADQIGLSRDAIVLAFPYSSYFEPEISLSIWPFLLIKQLLRPQPSPTYLPLTAQGFAELLATMKDNAPHCDDRPV